VSRRRRGALLLGLALLLGGLAASDVSRREGAIAREIGPRTPVIVVRGNLRAGAPLRAADLDVRSVPARYVPAGSYPSIADLEGRRLAVPVAAGTDVVPALMADEQSADSPRLRAGERAADVVAVGSAKLVQPGGRVDVAITSEEQDGRPGHTTLALRGAEVLAARAAPAATSGDGAGNERVAVSLRVTLRQALALAEAESYSRELRVLPLASGSRP
jgi:pilus assembly protein CpaB